MALAELRIIYRSNSHAPFWVVAEKSGIWEKNRLKVNTSPQLVREKAVEALKNGHVDLISGNHHNLYVRNATGEDFVHLAQAGNNWTENRLVTNGFRSVIDLKGKKVVVDNVKGLEAEIRDLIRGFVDAIHFFITRKQETLEILKEHASPILHLQSNEEVETLYEEWAHSLERKPYPSIEAIANVFQLAVRRNPEIASFNPLALWNSHYVRELDDSGYIDQLYQ